MIYEWFLDLVSSFWEKGFFKNWQNLYKITHNSIKIILKKHPDFNKLGKDPPKEHPHHI